MPGSRATLREQPDHVLEELEREGQVNMELLREIVTWVCQLGLCQVGDANATRALAINAIDATGQRTPQFFAILTDQHKGYHKFVGPRGFSIQAAFRKGSGAKPKGTNWVSDRFDYEKENQIWWRNDLPQDTVLDIDSIVAVVEQARNTFLTTRGITTRSSG